MSKSEKDRIIERARRELERVRREAPFPDSERRIDRIAPSREKLNESEGEEEESFSKPTNRIKDAEE